MLRFARTLRHTVALARTHAPAATGALAPHHGAPTLHLHQRHVRLQSTTAVAAASSAPAAAAAPLLEPSTAAATTLAAAAPAAPALPPDLITSGSMPDLTLLAPSFLDAGFPGYQPLLYVQYGLMQGVSGLHSVAGLEWWGAVVAASLALRVSTFLLCFVRSARMGAWMQHHGDALAAYTDRLSMQRAAGDNEAANATAREYMAFMASKDMNLLKNIAAPAVAQVVIFASFFTGLRKLADQAHLVPGLAGSQAVAGTWLTALHLPDPTFVLPAASIVFTIAAIATNPNIQGMPQAELTAGGQRLIFGTLSAVFNLVSCAFPSSVQLYLTVTSATMIAQQGVLRLPAFKRLFNFPADWPLPAEVLAARAAKRRESGKNDSNPMAEAMQNMAPLFRVASDLAEGKLRARPKHSYISFLGLRDPGVPPPPTTAPPPLQQ